LGQSIGKIDGLVIFGLTVDFMMAIVNVILFNIYTTMDPLIQLLRINSNRSHAELAGILGLSEPEVVAKIKLAEQSGVILGYHAIVDTLKAGQRGVTALIEVKITPEREGGFDRLARRISKFEQVRECYLMSGGYDLAVLVEGKDLLDVANFVAEKLSTIGGVISTATRFQLKAYKQAGMLVNHSEDEERMPVSP
jgi:DNA-binding Lrp family transcriptional regulator